MKLLGSVGSARERFARQAPPTRRDGIGIFVGSVLVVERPDAPLTSVAVWAPEVDTLLPQADYVAFSPAERTEAAAPPTVPFDIVAREAALVPEPAYARRATG